MPCHQGSIPRKGAVPGGRKAGPEGRDAASSCSGASPGCSRPARAVMKAVRPWRTTLGTGVGDRPERPEAARARLKATGGLPKAGSPGQRADVPGLWVTLGRSEAPWPRPWSAWGPQKARPLRHKAACHGLWGANGRPVAIRSDLMAGWVSHKAASPGPWARTVRPEAGPGRPRARQARARSARMSGPSQSSRSSLGRTTPRTARYSNTIPPCTWEVAPGPTGPL